MRVKGEGWMEGELPVSNRAVVGGVVWEYKALSPFPVRADCGRLQRWGWTRQPYPGSLEDPGSPEEESICGIPRSLVGVSMEFDSPNS